MNPIELIKSGIISNDMRLVRTGYTMLTGEVLAAETERLEKPVVENTTVVREEPEVEPVKANPRDSLDFTHQIRDPKKVEGPESRTRAEGGTYARREPINTRKIAKINIYEDTGEHAEDKDIDRLLSGQKGLSVLNKPRRPKAKMVEAICGQGYEDSSTGCGRRVDVHPAHARERFLCDKCITRRVGV